MGAYIFFMILGFTLGGGLEPMARFPRYMMKRKIKELEVKIQELEAENKKKATEIKTLGLGLLAASAVLALQHGIILHKDTNHGN